MTTLSAKAKTLAKFGPQVVMGKALDQFGSLVWVVCYSDLYLQPFLAKLPKGRARLTAKGVLGWSRHNSNDAWVEASKSRRTFRPKDVTTLAWALYDPVSRKFFQRGTHNSELDGDCLVAFALDATFFDDEKTAQFQYLTSGGFRKPLTSFLSSPPNEGECELGTFMQTCVAVPVTLSVSIPTA